MEELTKQDVCVKLKKLYDESEGKVTADAVVYRAYIDKVSSDTINEKVNAQLNAIKTGIYDINPKFKEGSKNYDSTKKLVAETLANYEKALIELSEFYDGKIEQLILRRVELEASLVGLLLNEEYLKQKVATKTEQKESDKVKLSIKDNIKLALEKLKNRKKENAVLDPRMIANLVDGQDVENELNKKLEENVEKTIQDKKDNKFYTKKDF